MSLVKQLFRMIASLMGDLWHARPVSGIALTSSCSSTGMRVPVTVTQSR
jgi:hypothetical protein